MFVNGPLSLLEGLDDTFLVANGDVLTTLDIPHMLEFHRHSGAAATIATHSRQVRVDLGVVQFNGGQAIIGYTEKPTFDYSVSMGIYIFEPRVLDYIPHNQYLDFPNLVLRLISFGEKVVGYPFTGYWQDLGRPALDGQDLVFHLGALIAIPYSYRHPAEVVETNVIGALNLPRLTAAQARRALYSHAMAGYLGWLKEHWSAYITIIPERALHYRGLASNSGAHLRLPETIALLMVGWEMGLRYALSIGALPASDYALLMDLGWGRCWRTRPRWPSWAGKRNPKSCSWAPFGSSWRRAWSTCASATAQA